MTLTKSKNQSVICYGEVLWDIFPNQTKPGGAPMNVAYHLNKFGVNSKMISRVGTDKYGQGLLQILNRWGISTHHCQIDDVNQTGIVNAIANQDHEMSYIIRENAAWDNIEFSEHHIKEVKNADAFVFGTLITRNETSKQTLYKLLNYANYKVFDINLRPPFYDKETIEYLLNQCNLLKLNESELQLISSWYSCESNEGSSNVHFLQDTYKIDEIIVTKGSKGATYYNLERKYFVPANKVKVKDTVGSGDSFLAAFLAKKIQNEPIETGMYYASALGAFVTSQEGACPDYKIESLDQLLVK
ncbi:carbohydrate kinase family protein [Plebeiibacterium sediminum]|uniref:Carbohydrate kinase n=1 Tax=Plebeiibacterium sediminum TaxID=2992112 RepID=A0AAE3M190_9BACT|nr:carbohydrate kinase [Plebeiobacterium sediminum]MCW3785258.1 carbohydrate kinase [Plebeiobacterium sediminum]